MTQVQRQAVLLALITRLQESGSWCGETHIQKTAYFLQEVFGVPLDFNFILYRHGPYTFDLNDALTALRADHLLTVQPVEGYGAHLYPAAVAAKAFLDRFPTTLGRYADAVRRVAEQFGASGVSDLERFATALYVMKLQPNHPPEVQAAKIHQLKPHVSVADGVAAIEVVKQFIAGVGAQAAPAI